jgi:hypothetical protein
VTISKGEMEAAELTVLLMTGRNEIGMELLR